MSTDSKSTTAATIRDSVRALIAETVLPDDGAAELRDDEDLLTVLNSLQFLRMVIELESRYAISIDNGELTPENLGTIERIGRFLEEKRGT